MSKLGAKQEIGRTYGVELLYKDPPRLVIDKLTEMISEFSRAAKVKTTPSTIMVSHEDAKVDYPDRTSPALTAIIPTDVVVDKQHLEPAIEQSWGWSDAEAVVDACRYQMLVTDMMSSGLDHRVRLEKFERTLLAVVLTTEPDAIHWQPAGKLVSPERFIADMRSSDPTARVFTALNVRLFNVMNGEKDEVVMDTLGLGALMLPDLQIHFSDLDSKDVAKLLFNTALYMYENGDVIEDGHTIGGLQPEDKWACAHEGALVGPDRIVLDVNPGAPFAAGNRE